VDKRCIEESRIVSRLYTVIGNGFLGKFIQTQTECTVFDSLTIDAVINQDHDVIIVAAPSSNRLMANSNPIADLENCKKLCEILKSCNYNDIILISTVDVFLNTHYGMNRMFIESELTKLNNVKLIRLPVICHSTIKKNVLFDIKNECWLDKININTKFQYYPLHRLMKDITSLLESDQIFYNLTSAPIQTESLINRFKPTLLHHMKKPNENLQWYDVKNYDDTYAISIEEIMICMGEYFNENRN
jgi:hypothetical protein